MRGVEGLYFYLNHFIASIYYSVPNNSMPFRTAVLIKKLGNFFLKRLEGLNFIEFIPFEKEFFEK